MVPELMDSFHKYKVYIFQPDDKVSPNFFNHFLPVLPDKTNSEDAIL